MPRVAFEALMQQISTLQATVDRLTAIIEEKEQIILNHNRARFGQSSEKRTYLLADGQLSMFEQAGDGIMEMAPEEVSRIEKQSRKSRSENTTCTEFQHHRHGEIAPPSR